MLKILVLNVILESHQLRNTRNTEEMTLLQMICGMIVIRENVKLLSFLVNLWCHCNQQEYNNFAQFKSFLSL